MLPSGLPEQISDDEPLARFLTSRSQYNQQGPKAAAFLPSPADNMTSVFRHDKEPVEGLWRIAQQALQARVAYGAAIVTAVHVRNAGLLVQAEEPPPRHANIVGWPNDPDDVELSRAHAKEVALRIVQTAEIVFPQMR